MRSEGRFVTHVTFPGTGRTGYLGMETLNFSLFYFLFVFFFFNFKLGFLPRHITIG